MIMKEETNNILNILFVGGVLLTIIFVVGGMTLDEVERGDYTMLVIIILVLIQMFIEGYTILQKKQQRNLNQQENTYQILFLLKVANLLFSQVVQQSPLI